MKKLSDDRIESIKKFLEKGRTLPDHYKEFIINQLEKTQNSLLFDIKKEYELIYADKEREEDILADTMAVPLQKVKTFRNGEMVQGTVPDLRSEARRIGTVPESWTQIILEAYHKL